MSLSNNTNPPPPQDDDTDNHGLSGVPGSNITMLPNMYDESDPDIAAAESTHQFLAHEGACSTSSAAKSAGSSSSTEFNRQFPLLTPRDNGMSTMFIGRRGDDDVGDTVE